MPDPDESAVEPPEMIVYDLDEAFTLLAALEDARDTLIESRYLVTVIVIEMQIQALNRRIGLDNSPGGEHG